MSLARSAPLRRELARALPERPFSIEFWDGSELAATGDAAANGADPAFRVRSPRAVAHALRAPGQLGLGRAYVAGELEVDDLDALIAVLHGWKPPPLDSRAKGRLALAAVRAAGLTRPPAPPRGGASTARDPSLEGARRARGPPPLRPAAGVLRPLPRSLDDLQLRDLLRRRRLARGGAGAQARARVPKARPEARRAGARRRLRLGQLSRSTPPRATASRWSASPCPSRRPGVARERAAEAGVGDRVEIRVMDYRDLAGERFDAIASIGMVEHVGEERIDLYAERLAGLLESGGRLLNHGIARLRHTDPDAGPFSERYVFPDAGAAPSLAGAAGARASRVRDRARRGLRGRLRGDPATLGPATGRAPRRGACAWPASSGCGCGGSTCARRATASRPVSPRSTRCSRGGPERPSERE